MNYTEFELNDRTYKGRLDVKGLLTLEERLGTNPVNVLMVAREGKLPKLGDLLTIIWSSCQKFEHGVSLDDIYEAWSAEMKKGTGIDKLIGIVIRLYQESGLISAESEATD